MGAVFRRCSFLCSCMTKKAVSLQPLQTDRSMFDQGCMRRQGDSHRGTSIGAVDGNRLIAKHSIDKGRHLSDKALSVTFEEEMEWKIAPHVMSIADDSCIRIVVSGRDCSCTA